MSGRTSGHHKLCNKKMTVPCPTFYPGVPPSWGNYCPHCSCFLCSKGPGETSFFLKMYFLKFTFQLQLTFNSMLLSGVQNSRHLSNLRSDLPDKSSTPLTTYVVIRILLTISCAVLYIPLFHNCQLYFLLSSPFLLSPSTLSLAAIIFFSLSVSLFLFRLLYIFRFHTQGKLYGICLYPSDLPHLA